ncbi:ImmA/IrrE family metallo-endopeptidase [Paracoccus sp. WLY502]|uniref:ImmA/IrrE family metallo-endopeptidase n=1 Tax=Paracoccus yibinensis TaxID=3068891 RepID=UPI00279666D3|nr:ImmA/IrrE family metallo-endopeptidase [Paracoccus sp. WLY502]MDQ1902353.1 ImmA/IrrE family metallo-endopeptidase [Paracoccus sp. WLY502]
MPIRISPGEKLLRDRGVSRPDQIDLVEIAWDLGAKVKLRRLEGCEARIIGEGNRAIISIDETRPERRRRFSLGHEIGHWMCHRGQCLACAKEDIGRGGAGKNPKERVADRYAADLLMPGFLMREAVRGRRLDLNLIEHIADLFNVSRLAAAVRLLEMEHEPCVLIRHSMVGMPWRLISSSVDRRWTPRLRVESDSHAYGILSGHLGDQPRSETVSAEDWFENDDAHRFEVAEQSFRCLDGEVLTLIVLRDEGMLAE